MDRFLEATYQAWLVIAAALTGFFTAFYDWLPDGWHPLLKGVLVGGLPAIAIIALIIAGQEFGKTIGSPIQWMRRSVLLLFSPYGRAKWVGRKDLRDLELLKPDGLFLGQWRGWLRRADLVHQGEGHFVTIALPGGGKSTSALIPSLLTSKSGSFIITDPKGELTAITRRHRESCSRVVYLNPFFKTFQEGTGLDYPDSGFNPFDLITIDENTKSQCDNFARLLMVTDRKESGSYFDDDGAELLSLFIFWIAKYEPEDNRNLVFLYELVRSDPRRTFEYMDHVDDPQLKFEAERFYEMLREAPAQWQGVVSKAILSTKRYVPESSLGNHVTKGKFDPLWLKQEDVTVYILLPAKHLMTGAPWLNMVIGLLGNAVGEVGKARPVTFLMDELPALGFLPDLRAYMRQCRSSGLRMWVFSQSIAALRDPSLYGKDGADDILALCDTKQFFSVGEYEHAKDISAMCGEASKLTRNQQDATGERSMGVVGVPLIRPEEVMGLKKNQQIIMRRGKPIKARLVPYFTRQKWQDMTDENPYRKKT